MRRNRNAKAPIFFAMLIPLFGLVFLIVGAVVTGKMAANKKVCTFETTAAVIDLERRESTDDDGDTVINYAPVYSYEYEGKSYNNSALCKCVEFLFFHYSFLLKKKMRGKAAH